MTDVDVHINSSKSIDALAREIASLFHIADFICHESDNYYDGSYFLSQNTDFKVILSREDTIGFDEFQFEVAFIFRTDCRVAPLSLGDILKKMLAISAILARRISHSQNRVERVIYRQGEHGTLAESREIVSLL